MDYISRNSSRYPKRMEALGGMPAGLYVQGALPDDGPSVAIVGARRCSVYGHKMADLFGSYLAARGVQIISGMALGIDGYAQEGALRAGGRTFAVLGCGVDICYPSSNRALFAKIPEHGGLISEFDAGTPPLPQHFPSRNRIISALADIVLIIEARDRSGSLITADFALEQGRTVFALPGRVGDLLSDGCNRLIAQGAGIAYSPEAVYEELMDLTGRRKPNVQRHPAKRAAPDPASDTASPVFEAPDLPDDSVSCQLLSFFAADSILSADELTARTGLPASEISARLVELSLCGYLTEYGRNCYALSSRTPSS